MSNAIAISRVEQVFATGTVALSGVDLAADEGEFVAIVGPSGCGKSTLLRMVAGLAAPTAGTVAVASENRAFVFQEANLLPWRTIVANVALPLELAGAPQARESARAALARVGLDAFADHYPRELSGGMRMRASLARALVTRPRVMLFDEPFGALDEITRHRLQDDLLAVHAEARFTALFVTHSVFEACYLADRVVVMSRRPGRVLAERTIPFPKPRGEALRTDPSFAPVVASVSDALRSELA